MTENPVHLCNTLHSHEAVTGSPSDLQILPSIESKEVKPVVNNNARCFSQLAHFSLRQELLKCSQSYNVSELMLHSGIGRGKRKYNVNNNIAIDWKSVSGDVPSKSKSESQIPPADPQKLKDSPVISNGKVIDITKKNMDPMKETSTYKKLPNGVDSNNHGGGFKTKPMRMNRFNNVSAQPPPLPCKTFENGVFPAHYTMQPSNIKHFRPTKEPHQFRYAKQNLPTLSKPPFPNEIDRIIYSKARPALCPPRDFMLDPRANFYIHNYAYNKTEIQTHVPGTESYSFSANNAFRKPIPQSLSKEVVPNMDKKLYYNSNNHHMKHYPKQDHQAGAYIKNSINPAKCAMPPWEAQNLCQQEKCTSSNSSGVANSYEKRQDYVSKCDTYPGKNPDAVASGNEGIKVVVDSGYSSSQNGKRRPAKTLNSPDDWSSSESEKLHKYPSQCVKGQPQAAEAGATTVSSSHSEHGVKELMHGNSNVRQPHGTFACKDSNVQTTTPFSLDKQAIKSPGTAGFEDESTSDKDPNSPTFSDSAPSSHGGDENPTSAGKLNRMSVKKRLSDEDSGIMSMEHKVLRDKSSVVLSPDSPVSSLLSREASETITTLSTRTDSVLSDSSSICSSSNSSMFKSESQAAQCSNSGNNNGSVPPVIIMDNCMPVENIAGISFGIEMNEILELCAKSSDMTPTLGAFCQEFAGNVELNDCKLETRESLDANQNEPKKENCLSIGGKTFQWEESEVDTIRCNMADIMGFLSDSWNLVHQKAKSDVGKPLVKVYSHE